MGGTIYLCFLLGCFAIQYCAASINALAASFPHLCVAAAKCIECCLLLIKDFLCYWPRVQQQHSVGTLFISAAHVCTCTGFFKCCVWYKYNDIATRRRNKSGRCRSAWVWFRESYIMPLPSRNHHKLLLAIVALNLLISVSNAQCMTRSFIFF